ncbi:MAG: succinate dehydrogenase, cytochrome b556 subunit [Armatimonadetes bacterium]|nr:succinate dehydrogenase, cytochrome b556 subunit [Armatimonadota bacterium]
MRGDRIWGWVLRYRGREGQWSWVLHRLTGIGIMLFLVVHIVDIALIGWGPATFNKLLFLYRHPLFRSGEILLFGAVLFHALNGIRIAVIDFWPAGALVHRRMFWLEIALFVLLFAPATAIMVHDMMKPFRERSTHIGKASPALAQHIERFRAGRPEGGRP